MFKISNGWVFSPKQDFAAFTFPVLFGLTLIPVLNGPRDALLALIALYLVDVIVNHGHVNATVYRVFFDRSEWDNRRIRLLAIPLICFAGCALIYSRFGISGVVFAIFYANIVHNMRQIVGWLACSRSREGDGDLSNRNWDCFIIYSSIGIPIVYWHAKSKYHSWLTSYYKPEWISVFADALLVSFWITIGAYFLREAWIWTKTRRINLPKYQILFTTCGIWYLAFVIFNPFAFTAALRLSHGVPYYCLIYKYSSKSPTFSPFLKKFASVGIVVFFFPIFLISHFRMDTLGSLFNQTYSPFYVIPSLSLSAPTETALVALLFFFTFSHFIFDMYLWKSPSHSVLAVIDRNAANNV